MSDQAFATLIYLLGLAVMACVIGVLVILWRKIRTPNNNVKCFKYKLL